MNEDRILAKAEKLGYTNLGKDNKEKIANLKEQLGIEDLDELESSLDGMLSEQPGEGEGLEDIEYLDDEIYEEGNNTSNSIQREQSELEEEIDDTENNDLENKENKNENNETNDLKSEDNKQKENNSDNSKNKDNTNKPNEKEKELDKESEKKSSNEKNPQSTKQKNSEKKLNEPNSKNNNSHNKFKGAKKTTEQKKAAPKLGKNKAVSKNVGKTPNASKAVSNIGKSVGKAGKALGNAIKKMAVQAGKAIAKAIGAAIKALLSNPYVLLALAIILVIVLLIMIIASFFDDFETNAQAYGYYDSTCDFNKVKINYTIDVVSSVYAEILDIGVYTLEIDEFIKGAALYYELISNYTDEEIKAMMIVLKTNALSKGEYKSDSETLYLNVLDMGYLPLSTANKKTKEKYDKLYDEVNEMLYLPNTVNGTINELGETHELTFNPIDFKDKGNNYTDILNSVYNNESLTIYSLADNCTFISPSCDAMSINSTSLSKNEFVEKLKTYYSNSSSVGGKVFAENASTIYEVATKNNVNPELVVVRAVSEGFSPGGVKNNYWGMGCTNTGGYKACITYDSFADGVLGFVQNISQYDSVSSMMKKYAYIGANWYNPGSSSIGGCYYYNYIKEFMSSSRAAEVGNICSSSSTCDKSGGKCTATIEEDQLAYSKWQVYKMSLTRQNIFGIGPDTCNSYTSDCTIYAQSDSRWGKKKLGKSSATMSGSGCAVTSIAIGISCSKTALTVDNFDAGVFVDKLNKGNCFTDNGSITWGCSAISEIAPSVKSLGKTILTGFTNEQKNEKINAYDLKNHFILLHFKNDAHKRGHWVVYSSTSGDYYITKDPAGGKITNQLISEIDSMVVYEF